MSKVPLHEFERAKKAEKVLDGFLMFLATVTILGGAGILAWCAVTLLSFLLPIPWLFWGILIAGSLALSWWAGLAAWEHYHEIVKQGKKHGTIDE